MITEFDNKDGIADATRGTQALLQGRHLISQTSCTRDLRLIAVTPPHVVISHADAHSEPEV